MEGEPDPEDQNEEVISSDSEEKYRQKHGSLMTKTVTESGQVIPPRKYAISRDEVFINIKSDKFDYKQDPIAIQRQRK